jgi:SpoVK/Ycf46/Vps4 family AAA+-type ATPase
MLNYMLLEEGVSEMKLVQFFEKVKQHEAAILIIDEIDIISGRASARKSKLDIRIFSVLLHLIDQLGQNGFIIGK